MLIEICDMKVYGRASVNLHTLYYEHLQCSRDQVPYIVYGSDDEVSFWSS